MKQLFLLFGTSPAASRRLTETFRAVSKHYRPSTVLNCSRMSYADIKTVRRLAESHGWKTTTYVLEGALPVSLDESWIKNLSTYGLLRYDSKNVIVLRPHGIITEVITHIELMREAEEKQPDASKPPSEVDTVRAQQKQSDLFSKQRQGAELLAAQERELQDKAREAQQKLLEPKKTKVAEAEKKSSTLGFDLNYSRDGI